jgi:hypothetical protein
MHFGAGYFEGGGTFPETCPLQNLIEVQMAAGPAHRARNQGSKTGTGDLGHVEYDETDFKNRLSDEYKILQDKIDKIGGFRFTIKGWSITAVVAGIGIAGQKGLATGCIVAIGLVVMLVFFFILEHEQVRQSRIFGDRAGRIEDAFRRIRRGKGEEVFASLPVPYLAHELVIARLRERTKGRARGSSLQANTSAAVSGGWRVLREAHINFYAVLIFLSLASLLPQHRAIATHWKEFRQSIGQTWLKAKPGTEELPGKSKEGIIDADATKIKTPSK